MRKNSEIPEVTKWTCIEQRAANLTATFFVYSDVCLLLTATNFGIIKDSTQSIIFSDDFSGESTFQ